MWRSRNDRDGTTVVCIACGASLPRSETREYDKHGDRWERHGKSFEHLCKECYRDLCHQPRAELEALLVDIEDELRSEQAADRPRATDGDVDNGAANTNSTSDSVSRSQAAFLSKYVRTVEARYGSGGDPDSDAE